MHDIHQVLLIVRSLEERLKKLNDVFNSNNQESDGFERKLKDSSNKMDTVVRLFVSISGSVSASVC